MLRADRHAKVVKLPPDKRTLVVTVVTFASLTHGVAATEIPIAPEPVGSGARALGQSAFIAVADDATAASWNPAGLIQLERSEASFVGVWKTISNDPSVVGGTESLEGETWSETEVNFMSYVQPIEVGKTDVVLSVNYHQVYDLGLEYDNITYNQTVRSNGAISAYSLAGALSMPYRPELTLGAAFNWYTQSLCNDCVRQVKTRRPTRAVTETLDNLKGYNFSVGVLWDAYEKQESLLTLGLVCHTPFAAEVDEELVENSMRFDPERLDIDFPLSVGAGLNYRFSDKRSVAFDVQWTDWSEYKYTGATLSPDDILACRLGFECLKFSPGGQEWVGALRGGVFYEPRPAWSDILPVYGFSLGLGWTVKEQFSLDFAYQFRWGDGDDFTADGTTYFDYGIEEHWLIASVITYF